MYQYIALGIAIAEVLYVVSAIWRKEANIYFVTLLSLIILVLCYLHFHT